MCSEKKCNEDCGDFLKRVTEADNTNFNLKAILSRKSKLMVKVLLVLKVAVIIMTMLLLVVKLLILILMLLTLMLILILMRIILTLVLLLMILIIMIQMLTTLFSNATAINMKSQSGWPRKINPLTDAINSNATREFNSKGGFYCNR